MTIHLRDLQVCFEGVIPSIIATASPDGVPNISYLSHVALVDDEHVALSDQFFSKTAANIRGNNNAAVMLVDPRDGSQYRLSVIFQRSLDSGMPTVNMWWAQTMNERNPRTSAANTSDL